MSEDFLYKEETYKIRGACFKVWNEFGGAFKEGIIERALLVELKELGFSVATQVQMPIYI